MNEALEKYNQFHRELIVKNIAEMKKHIEEKQEALAQYESTMTEIDHISYWDMSGPESVTDVEDRKKIVAYLYEKLSTNSFKADVVKCGLFWSWKNIPHVCKYRNIECPQWFLEKYQ